MGKKILYSILVVVLFVVVMLGTVLILKSRNTDTTEVPRITDVDHHTARSEDAVQSIEEIKDTDEYKREEAAQQTVADKVVSIDSDYTASDKTSASYTDSVLLWFSMMSYVENNEFQQGLYEVFGEDLSSIECYDEYGEDVPELTSGNVYRITDGTDDWYVWKDLSNVYFKRIPNVQTKINSQDSIVSTSDDEAYYSSTAKLEYAEWEARALANGIDDPLVEEAEAMSWLVSTCGIPSSSITWVSWYSPADDDSNYDTIKIIADSEEYLIRRYKDPVSFELYDAASEPANPGWEYVIPDGWKLPDEAMLTVTDSVKSKLTAPLEINANVVYYAMWFRGTGDLSSYEFIDAYVSNDLRPNTYTVYLTENGIRCGVCWYDNAAYFKFLD
ncbi:MAG: hypothetical protein NC548_10940 [Lachnospiraceae bacterium]|nr:hypothetical protein [Lachnospiraceae bacterium]MCM1233825.1 hypothetical protein [Ruminococcus flavefaciens]